VLASTKPIYDFPRIRHIPNWYIPKKEAGNFKCARDIKEGRGNKGGK